MAVLNIKIDTLFGINSSVPNCINEREGVKFSKFWNKVFKWLQIGYMGGNGLISTRYIQKVNSNRFELDLLSLKQAFTF